MLKTTESIRRNTNNHQSANSTSQSAYDMTRTEQAQHEPNHPPHPAVYTSYLHLTTKQRRTLNGLIPTTKLNSNNRNKSFQSSPPRKPHMGL